MSENIPQQQQINVELGEKEAEGSYSNLVIISHSPAEFIFDFTRLLPGIPKAKVHSRIIMTPQHSKMFLAALKENIEKYENSFGEIPTLGTMNENAMGFRIPQKGNEKIN